MNRAVRFILAVLGALTGLAVFLFVAGLLILQTSWFRNKVRTEVISTIEHATGGRVDLGAFDYDRGKRTAEFKNLVLHGSEAPGQAPFFRADSIRIQLTLLSLWERSVDLESVAVKRPQLHILVRPDGSTNIPEPQTGPFDTAKMVTELLRLKVKRFDFANGSLETNLQKSQLNGYGEDLNLVLQYNQAGPRYVVSFASQNVKIDSRGLPPILLNVDAQAQLAKQELTIQHLLVTSVSKHSTLEASGAITNFVHPEVNLNVDGRVMLQELAKQVNESAAVDGELAFAGIAHYAGWQKMSFKGHLTGKQLVVGNGLLKPVRFDADSDVLADAGGINFNRLNARALGSSLSGALTLDKERQFRLNGKVEGVNLQQLISVNGQPLPWSATLSGPVHAQGHITPHLQDLQAQAQLQLFPASSGGTPLAGFLDLAYRKADGTIRVEDSQLTLPNTRATISGVWGDSLKLVVDSTGVGDIKPVLALMNKPLSMLNSFAVGAAHFDGAVNGAVEKLLIVGDVQATDVSVRGLAWKRVRSHISVAANGADFSAFAIDGPVLHAKGDGHLSLTNWRPDPQKSLRLAAAFQGADMSRLLSALPAMNFPSVKGIAAGSLKVNGSLANPQGSGDLTVDSIDAYGEHLNLTKISASIAGDEIRISSGRVQAGPAVISFSGQYGHAPHSWETGRLEASLDSNGFPIASLGWVRRYEPGLNAQFEVHTRFAASISPGSIQPGVSDGTAILRGISVNNVRYGDLLLKAATKNNQLNTDVTGNLRDSHIGGHVQIALTGANMVSGSLNFGTLNLSTVASLLNPARAESLPVEGQLAAEATFSGPLQRPTEMRATVRVSQFKIQPKAPIGETKPADLIFCSQAPVELEAANGVASFRELEIHGPETALKIAGSVPYIGASGLALKANGTVDLRLLQMFQPSLHSSGRSVLAVSVEGTPANPSVNGTLQLSGGSLFVNSLPSGLTAIDGTVRFANDRATIQKLTAESGGGRVSLSGNVNFRGANAALVYNLKANAQDVRFRYGGGVSVTANSDLNLTGASNNSLVSGNITISRVAVSENVDAGNLLASVSAPTPAPSNQKDFVTGLRLDVHVESAPNLQLNTSLSRNIGAEVDLRLRGRPDHPSLLGSVSVNQGDIRIFGAKYSINRGQVNFFNPAKIEPVLDLDLQTESRGITVDITVSGSVNKLNINYRSDPPLQPRDIIALLAVGRAPDIASSVPNAQITNDASALQTGANTVLGQAISPVSNRLSKLFGITNIKIDPLVQGITNTPQARLTVEQQISRDVTVTYITNLSETSEQIFRFEWALSQHYSVIALRDDNGEFGLDLQYKKRFK